MDIRLVQTVLKAVGCNQLIFSCSLVRKIYSGHATDVNPNTTCSKHMSLVLKTSHELKYFSFFEILYVQT